MDDALYRGLPFETTHLWPSPALAGGLRHDASSLDAWRSDITTVQSFKPDLPQLSAYADRLEIPLLDHANGDELASLTPEDGDVTVQTIPGPDHDSAEQPDDIWGLDLDPIGELKGVARSSTLLRTWDTLGQADGPACLSEAGASPFDAALAPSGDSIGVLPRNHYLLRALCSLVRGRSSGLFRWNDSSDCFEQILPRASLSGTSLPCAASLIASLLSMGTLINRLRTLVDCRASIRRCCPALLAFRSSVASIVDAIDESLSSRLITVKSLLQFQNTLTHPRRLLAMLNAMAEMVKNCKTDEEIISLLSDYIHAEVQSERTFCSILQILLTRVSVPWLESLTNDTGFCIPTMVVAGYNVDSGEQVRSSSENSSFLSAADQSLVRETKLAIAMLRRQSSNHPLLRARSIADNPALACFTKPSLSNRDVSEAVEMYEAQEISLWAYHGSGRESSNFSSPGPVAYALNQDCESDTIDQRNQVQDLEDLGKLMSGRPQIHTVVQSDVLHQRTLQRLDNIDDGDTDVFTQIDEISPIDRVRPFLIAQCRLANGVLLRHLLRRHQLRQHFDLQRSFQLLGNGTFVSRLSTALFNEHVQSAERRRGVIPTAETMGLRVGASADQHWPPASSELQLTLGNILNDSALPDLTKDKLSFAIRELPEEEIERVLDPQSIHALDFLRLQYTASSPLDAIFTSETLDKYDDIFRFLLKLLRMLHITATLPRKTLAGRDHSCDTAKLAFAHEARLFVTVLVSHFMDIGIGAPWRQLMGSVSELERILADEDSTGHFGTNATLSIEGLQQLHRSCLDRIRHRLFLKRKQEKLANAVEIVLVNLLKVSSSLQAGRDDAGGTFESSTNQFRSALASLVRLLQEVVDKPQKTVSVEEEEDAGVVRLLLTRLNWNGNYEEDDRIW